MASGQWVSSASFPAQRLVESRRMMELTPARILLPFSRLSSFYLCTSPCGQIHLDKGKAPSLHVASFGLCRVKAAEMTLARLQWLAKHKGASAESGKNIRFPLEFNQTGAERWEGVSMRETSEE